VSSVPWPSTVPQDGSFVMSNTEGTYLYGEQIEMGFL